MTYAILTDYGSEGHSFITKDNRSSERAEFATAQEALDFALSDKNYTSAKWQIVGLINWKGVTIDEKTL